jgi:hypothetical protein
MSLETALGRSAHARAILGPELFNQLTNVKVLLVGAGGIGCELRECSIRGVCLFPPCAVYVTRRAETDAPRANAQ